jgi:hypothetical protein
VKRFKHQVLEGIPPEVAMGVIAAPMAATAVKHIAKNTFKAVRGAMKAKKAIRKSGEKFAKKVVR